MNTHGINLIADHLLVVYASLDALALRKQLLAADTHGFL